MPCDPEMIFYVNTHNTYNPEKKLIALHTGVLCCNVYMGEVMMIRKALGDS